MTFTAEDKFNEATREFTMRMRVYERLVGAGKMTKASAESKIAIMKEIAEDYLAQLEEERLL